MSSFGGLLLLGLDLGLPLRHGRLALAQLLPLRLLAVGLLHLRIRRQADALPLIINHHVGRRRLAAPDRLRLG